MDTASWMDALIESMGRPCSIAELGALPVGGARSSRLLGPALLPEGEAWPSVRGVLMSCLLQVRVDELPVVPGWLEGIAWMSVFSTPNILHRGWSLRRFPTLSGMRWRPVPKTLAAQQVDRRRPWTPRGISWHHHTDMPDRFTGDLAQMLSTPQQKLLASAMSNRGFNRGPNRQHAAQTKIGGYPSMKQGADEDGPSHHSLFDLQIMYDLEGGYDLCDCAITYIGRLGDAWVIESQTS